MSFNVLFVSYFLKLAAAAVGAYEQFSLFGEYGVASCSRSEAIQWLDEPAAE